MRRSLLAALVTIVLVTVGLVALTGTGSALGQVAARPSHTCRHHQCPSPTPTSPSPSTTQTSPSSSPSPSPSPSTTGGGPYSCTATGQNGTCPSGGAYDAPNLITNSNGYNTYVENNCWGDPTCQQTMRANSPGDWQVTAKEPAGSTAVAVYPNVQQLTNNWAGSGWGGSLDVPVAALAGLTGSYAESMPQASSGTIAQIAWDIWISNAAGHSDEIMVWMDNQGRGTGGATFYGTYTIGGQPWSLYHYGGNNAETIWMPGTQNQFAHLTSATVDLKALLSQLVTLGLENANITLGQIDFGWEICSTGGVSQAFTVTDYHLTLTP